jgi:muramoyltetrapeptide carboxypeptidase LdcA involved in peptidoglycan recycling
MNTFRILTLALVASVGVAAAHAQTPKPDVTIAGTVNQTTELTGANLVISMGQGDVASNVGAIFSSDISGAVTQTTTVEGANLVIAMGDGSVSSDVGTIANAKIGGKATQKTSVKGANLVISMDKGEVCSTVGSIGKPCANKN